jgi:pantoate--beta-alanine ligase
MDRLTTLAAWRAYADDARARGHTVGLVPTMGALHAGHASLIAAAAARNDIVIVTIFVNPRQFNDATDLANYPVTLDDDLEQCDRAGATPTLEEMWPSYPRETNTTVHVGGLADVLEGAGRPGHFDGVTSVVAKLFTVTGPCATYFGEKDFQQLAIVRQMVTDLAFPVTVVAGPIVRDTDGLALSSRNVRLSADARRRALALSGSLRAVAAAGPVSASCAREVLRASLSGHELDVAYAEVVDPATCESVTDAFSGDARALVAAVVDGVRLVDNGPVRLRAPWEVAHAAGD